MKKKTTLFTPVQTKIYKTSQTRGADDDVIYQNRVKRNGTVLIPYAEYESCKNAPSYNGKYENGFIVLIKPEDYFAPGIESIFKLQGLKLGQNMLVFYETRDQWNNYPKRREWKPATSRKAPLGGEYVARVPATTAAGQGKNVEGYNISKMKGAGIRVYEYADSETIELCKLQLEYLFWLCYDIETFLESSGSQKEALEKRRNKVLKDAHKKGVDDITRLKQERIIDDDGNTICPLCLEKMSVMDFASKMIQAEGRQIPDLTITNTSLFHIQELRSGQFNHRLYNLGWGHHHCNVTVADKGVEGTLDWMKRILEKNDWI